METGGGGGGAAIGQGCPNCSILIKCLVRVNELPCMHPVTMDLEDPGAWCAGCHCQRVRDAGSQVPDAGLRWLGRYYGSKGPVVEASLVSDSSSIFHLPFH